LAREVATESYVTAFQWWLANAGALSPPAGNPDVGRDAVVAHHTSLRDGELTTADRARTTASALRPLLGKELTKSFNLT